MAYIHRITCGEVVDSKEAVEMDNGSIGDMEDNMDDQSDLEERDPEAADIDPDLDTEPSDMDLENSDPNPESSDTDPEPLDANPEPSDTDPENSDPDPEPSDTDPENSDPDPEPSDTDSENSDPNPEPSDTDPENSDSDDNSEPEANADESMDIDSELFEPLYDGARITVCGAYCALMEFKRTCKLPFSAMLMLLQLLQLLCPPGNKLPQSIYVLKKFFQKHSSQHTRKLFCPECHTKLPGKQRKCANVECQGKEPNYLITLKPDRAISNILRSKSTNLRNNIHVEIAHLCIVIISLH